MNWNQNSIYESYVQEQLEAINTTIQWWKEEQLICLIWVLEWLREEVLSIQGFSPDILQRIMDSSTIVESLISWKHAINVSVLQKWNIEIVPIKKWLIVYQWDASTVLPCSQTQSDIIQHFLKNHEGYLSMKLQERGLY